MQEPGKTRKKNQALRQQRSGLGPGTKMENVPNQGLAKEMRAVLKTLRENISCKLSGGLGARVLPGESKKEV